MTIKVALAFDHAAYHVREQLMEYIREAGKDFEPVYMGPPNENSVDYPDYAEPVANAVAKGEVQFGVLICGTGIGMSIAANKVPGVRAALCHDHLTAELTRQHNNSNVVCAGERVVGMEVIRDIIKTFLTTPFSGSQRHQGRLDKITVIEKKHA